MSLRRSPVETTGMSSREAASAWFARLDQGNLSAAEQQAFESWLDASHQNRRAFDQVEASWDLFDADDGEDAGLRALRQSALAANPKPRRRGWYYGVAALAASVAVIAISLDRQPVLAPVAPHGGGSGRQLASMESFGTADYVTRRGERLNISLPDGTAVALNTATELDVAFDGDRRRVRLIRGQAYFEVAKDPAHPFIVMAGDKQIVALGTQFDVRFDRGELKVSLVEGKVAVEPVAAKPRAGGMAAAKAVVMSAGEQLVVAGAMQLETKSAEVQRESRWRDGFIEFQDATLLEAAEEYNRYMRRRIVIDDPRVAQLRVTGLFRTDGADRFLAAMSGMLPVAIDQRGADEVRVVWAGD